MPRILIVILTVLLSLSGFAAHLVGGEITYECLGNNQYRINLRIYRDCNSTGAPFDTQAAITIFDSQGNQIQNIGIPHGQIFFLPTTVNNPCLQSPPNVCTQYTDYTGVVTLPPIPGGYTITHQRCCRNNTISNIPNPGDWGNTYTVQIPSNDNCNSTPEFTTEPPIVLCLNDPLQINSAVSESDGDSIHYMLCSPLHGGGTNQPSNGQTNCLTCPAPNPAAAPPYANVPFIAPRSAANPIPSSPQITINSTTGMITGTPTQLGQFVFAVCVEEYRNGVLLSTIRRDYQFNVTNCSSNVRSGIEAQIINQATICTGTTISFEEDALNAVTYFWDFGDPSTNADTSTSPNPTYTYADTGTYVITLTVNKGYPCEDIATATFDVRHPVSFIVTNDGNTCLDAQGLTFTAQGNFSADAEYTWTFPAGASLTTFNGPSPPPITFNNSGVYTVQLTVEDFGCQTTMQQTVSIGLRPTFDATPPPSDVCAPFALDLQHSATAEETVYYEWDFGDGNTSTDANPEYVYEYPGNYSGYLRMYTTQGCTDTAFYQFDIVVYPSPNFELNVSPNKTDIFTPVVYIQVDSVGPNDDFIVSTGDGAMYQNQSNITHTYSDTGWYEISVAAENQFGCATEEIYMFRVAPIPLVYPPNAFTPNGDGVNDGFRTFSSGYKQFRLEIFDRWGNQVFISFDAFEWWDGNDINSGEACAEGVYVWIVKFLGTEGDYIEETGTVTLMR